MNYSKFFAEFLQNDLEPFSNFVTNRISLYPGSNRCKSDLLICYPYR